MDVTFPLENCGIRDSCITSNKNESSLGEENEEREETDCHNGILLIVCWKWHLRAKFW